MGTIPNFCDDYHLPSGEHICTLEEIEDVFVWNDTRKRRWTNFIDMLKRICELQLTPDVILLNGSFVTGRKEPGDVDFAALFSPDTIRAALAAEDSHDVDGVRLFLQPNNQGAIRGLFGAHLLSADNQQTLDYWSKLFSKGQNGKLREPDPQRDPSWVTRPKQKGILKVYKDDILI